MIGSIREGSVRIGRFIAVLAIIGLLTFIDIRIALNVTSAGFFYLLAVLLIATFGELSEAVVASFSATVCLGYFVIPPMYRFSIDDPKNWTALMVFLATSIIVSKLSSTARSQTAAALTRSREMEQLYTLSRAILLNTSPESTGRETALQIARIFEFTGVSLLEHNSGNIYRAGVPLPEWDDKLRIAARNGTLFEDRETVTVSTSVRLGADVIGSMVLRGHPPSDSALQSLANLVAIALERARMIEITTAANLIRKSDDLKSTLLDAIAHEFKTPLTSIKAAASALRSGVGDPPARQEYIEIIDEEADRLERLVTGAVQMARVEAGGLRLHKQKLVVSDLIDGAVQSVNGLLDGHTIHQDVALGLSAIADPELIQLALKQVLENALKYSPAGSTVSIEASEDNNEVLIAVTDTGPGIPQSEQRHIFDRYFRSPSTRQQVPGTGIGLAIAREIMASHEGRIWAQSKTGEGSRFILALPTLLKEQPA